MSFKRDDISNIFKNIEKNFTREIPKLIRQKCIKCGECGRDICPVDAISFEPTRFPIFDLKKCTSCGKCVEICTYKAIFMKKANFRGLMSPKKKKD